MFNFVLIFLLISLWAILCITIAVLSYAEKEQRIAERVTKKNYKD